jgi:hypothetical protein
VARNEASKKKDNHLQELSILIQSIIGTYKLPPNPQKVVAALDKLLLLFPP